MIFVDSNIPMYLVGAQHAHKTTARLLVERSITDGERLVTDAEVLQEVLHRYDAIRRRDAIGPAFAAILEIVDEVLSIELADAARAKDILLGAERLSARDALHVAVMERHGVNRIMSFDRGFDAVPSVTRVSS